MNSLFSIMNNIINLTPDVSPRRSEFVVNGHQLYFCDVSLFCHIKSLSRMIFICSLAVLLIIVIGSGCHLIQFKPNALYFKNRF